MPRDVLLLDIDETIVHVSRHWLNRAPDFTFRLCRECHHCYIRPGLAHFLKSARARFDIGVWTAATYDYGKAILKRIFGPMWRSHLVCFYHRRHCIIDTQSRYVKDLRRIWTRIGDCGRVWMIDDNIVHKRFNESFAGAQVFLCRPYVASDHMDDELKRVWRKVSCQIVRI